MSKKRKDHEPETEAVDQVEAGSDAVAVEAAADGRSGSSGGDGGRDRAEQSEAAGSIAGDAESHENGSALDADAPDAPADDAAVDASGAAAGPAGEPGDAEKLDPSALEADAETAGEVPGTADPVADAIDADDDQPEAAETGGEWPLDAESPRTPQNRDVNALAALAAASVAFGTTNDDNTALPRMDVSWLGVSDDSGERGIDVAMKAAAFVRANPDAPTAATRIELRRKKLAQPAEGDREAEAWEIFMFVLARLDTLDRTRREAEEAERRRIEQKPLSIPASQAALLPRETFQR